MVSFNTLVSVLVLGLASTRTVSAAVIRPKMLGSHAELSSSVSKRDSDLCAEVSLTASLNLLLVTVQVPDLKVCLCLSGLPDLLQTDASVVALVNVLGIATVTADIQAQLNEKGKHCTYPDFAVPQCLPSSPCGFTCPSPYRKIGGKCVLTSSKRAARRDVDRCAAGQSKCGAPGGHASFECVDTKTSLESCGGCVVPLLGQRPSGQDCTQLAGVSDVACIQGTCRVSRCEDGYYISADSSRCLSTTDNSQLVLTPASV